MKQVHSNEKGRWPLAKKPTESEPIVFTSEVLRMVNEQTMSADASVEAAESLTTPGVSDGSDGAMFVLEVKVSFSPLLATGRFLTAVASSRWTTQLQTGNRVTGAAIIDPTSPYYFASRTFYSTIVTSGVAWGSYPVDLDLARPEPVIVMNDFTIVHLGVNNAVHNDELVFTEILYRTCMLHSDVYNRALRNQSRLS